MLVGNTSNAVILRLDTDIDGIEDSQISAVGENGDLLVGGVVLTYKGRRAACITRLFVHPDMRRMGVGRRLVKECAYIAKCGGCETLGLLLGADNSGAMRFYETIGFVFAYQYEDGSSLMSMRL